MYKFFFFFSPPLQLSIWKDDDVNGLEGQGAACSALAAAYQSLGSMDSAVQHLEQFLDIATKTDNLIAQGEACCNLGVIYNRRGEFAKAMQLFEKNFEIARSTVNSGQGDRKLVRKVCFVFTMTQMRRDDPHTHLKLGSSSGAPRVRY